jgi:transcriptional regulator with XRE-family HTH domain
MEPIDRKLKRIALRLKQTQLSRMMGVSVSYLSRLENIGYDVSPNISRAYDRLLERLEAEQRNRQAAGDDGGDNVE